MLTPGPEQQPRKESLRQLTEDEALQVLESEAARRRRQRRSERSAVPVETGDRVVRMTLPPRSDGVDIESDIDVFKEKERWRRLRQWGLEVEGERKLPKPDQEEERWEEERQRIRGRGWELMSEQRLLNPDIEEERRPQPLRDLESETESERTLPTPDPEEDERWQEERLRRLIRRGLQVQGERKPPKPDPEEERRRQLWRDLGPYLGPELESERNPLKPDMEEERWRQHRERRLELKIEQKAR